MTVAFELDLCGGTQALMMKTGLWRRTVVTTGGVRSSEDDLPGSESSSTSEKLCGFEQVP